MSHWIMSLVREGVASQQMAGSTTHGTLGDTASCPQTLSGSVHSNHIRRTQGVHGENIMNVGTAWQPIYPWWWQFRRADGKFP